MQTPIIYWFRRDLRILDNSALKSAVDTKQPILFIYIHDQNSSPWSIGSASKWWLHHSLLTLEKSLLSLKSRLYFFSGSTKLILEKLISQTNCNHVICNQQFEPEMFKNDKELVSYFEKQNVTFEIKSANLLFNPNSIFNKQGNVYKVFTPFYKTCIQIGFSTELINKPNKLNTYQYKHKSDSLMEFALTPKISWDEGLKATWQPGENAAHKILKNIVSNVIENYTNKRDYPELDSTSHLSPYLHFGEITPQRIIHALTQASFLQPSIEEQKHQFIRQLIWREFSHYILFHFPHTSNTPFQEKFKRFPWKRSDKTLLIAWQKGKTGYPIIDAGMRELWHTGYMHNRVRMITASFLTKNGLLNWKQGASWFWDTLVDADLAQNSMNWQWVAGCGVDAAPFFRIFNPVTQSKKFDEKGNYIRQWCPELSRLSNKDIHTPWLCNDCTLNDANINLGIHYPKPIIDLSTTRERALSLFKSL